MVAGVPAPTELGKENHQLGNLDFHVDRNRLHYGASGPGNDFTLQREHAIGCCNLLHHGRYDREQYRFRSGATDLFLYSEDTTYRVPTFGVFGRGWLFSLRPLPSGV